MALEKPHFNIMDIILTEDGEMRWDGSCSFDDLPKKKVLTKSLHKDVQDLHYRLLDEIKNYFTAPNDHQLVAMVVDPVMMTSGLPFLRATGQGDLVDIALAVFKTILNTEAVRVWKPTVLDEPVDSSLMDDNYDSDDPFSTALRNNAIPRKNPAVVLEPVQQTASQMADEAYDAWMNLLINWHAFLRNDQRAELSDGEKVKISRGDCFFLTSKVDIVLWYRLNGKDHTMASRIVAPGANGVQERVFSFCRLIDTHMRQSLGSSKFEMLTLLAFNKELIRSASESGPLSISCLLDSLRSSTSAVAAAAALTEFFDLDTEDAKDIQATEEGSMADMLKRAADCIDEEASRAASKRFKH